MFIADQQFEFCGICVFFFGVARALALVVLFLKLGLEFFVFLLILAFALIGLPCSLLLHLLLLLLLRDNFLADVFTEADVELDVECGCIIV